MQKELEQIGLIIKRINEFEASYHLFKKRVKISKDKTKDHLN